jgi:hypothetical protein
MLTRIAFVGLAILAVPARAAPPIHAYGRLPSIEDAALSPDGTKVAYVRTTQEDRYRRIYPESAATVTFK